MLTTELINRMISVGRLLAEQPESARDAIEALRPYDRVNRLAPADWNRATTSIQTDDLAALVRALTVAERQHRWAGGSVAAVIWVFREIERRSASDADGLADWVLAHTLNPYLPYGGQNHGARSLAEYRTAAKSHQTKIAQGLAAQRESEARAARERQLLSEQRRRAVLLRKSPTRERLIQELGRLSLREQLQRIASDSMYPATFYPTRCADGASVEVIESLTHETRLALLTKLKGKQKGPWAKLKSRLRALEPLPWNRERWF